MPVKGMTSLYACKFKFLAILTDIYIRGLVKKWISVINCPHEIFLLLFEHGR
jgi:ribosomal protein S3AE